MEENQEIDQPEQINVTGELTIQDRMKLVSGITREIKHQVKPESAGEHLYDGGTADYHNWWRATLNQLSGIYMDGIEDLVKLPSFRTITEEQWEARISQADRQFIYQITTASITQLQLDVVEDAHKNGLKVLKHYYELWGAPTLSNTIKAMSELTTLKVPRHDNPSSNFKRLEKIFSEFFPNAETVMASLAWMHGRIRGWIRG